MTVAITGTNEHIGGSLVREMLRCRKRCHVLIQNNDPAVQKLDVSNTRCQA